MFFRRFVILNRRDLHAEEIRNPKKASVVGGGVGILHEYF